MIVVVLFALFVGLVLWLRRRSSRRKLLAGLDGSKPVFQSEPPLRRVGLRKSELL